MPHASGCVVQTSTLARQELWLRFWEHIKLMFWGHIFVLSGLLQLYMHMSRGQCGLRHGFDAARDRVLRLAHTLCCAVCRAAERQRSRGRLALLQLLRLARTLCCAVCRAAERQQSRGRPALRLAFLCRLLGVQRKVFQAQVGNFMRRRLAESRLFHTFCTPVRT